KSLIRHYTSSQNFSPHQSTHPIRIYNYSRGGLLFRHVREIWDVSTWYSLRPETTLFVVGSCDLASMSLAQYEAMGHAKRHWFYKQLIETVEFFRTHAHTLALDAAEHRFIREYKFSFSYLSDWGLNFVPNRSGNMNPADLRHARNENNKYVSERARYLYVTYGIIMARFNPYRNVGIYEPVRDGVHLAGDSLQEFLSNVKRFLARKFCIRCGISSQPPVNTILNFKAWLDHFIQGSACDQLDAPPEPVSIPM
ncbi:unnamed protein product, partial [Meganyctiphanes norvegica]